MLKGSYIGSGKKRAACTLFSGGSVVVKKRNFIFVERKGCFGLFFRNKACFAFLLRLFLSQKVINNSVNRITPRWLNVPLTETVEFKTVLQKGNRFQLPKLIRWKFKLETVQILKVTAFPAKGYTGECFYAKMDKKRTNNHTCTREKTLGIHKMRQTQPDWIGCGDSSATSIKRASKK